MSATLSIKEAAMAYQRDHASNDEQTAAVVDPASVAPEPVAGPRHAHHSHHSHSHGDAEVLKVSTRSRPSAVAGAIAGVIRESGQAEVQSIGAGATNQAIKAVAIARSYLQEEGVNIVCVPSFIDVAIDEEERTAIRLLIKKDV
jgi:stage V sporulation protein S